MTGRNEVVKIGIWKVDKEDLETIKMDLEYNAKKFAVFAKRMQYVLNKWDNKNEYELEELLNDICEFYGDCRVCPIRFYCEFALEACTEVYNCETCPRVRICVRDKAPGLIKYLGGE
jgi:hypothetical protein